MTAVTTATTRIEALHHWPDAPPHRAYLSHPHRHLFGLAVTVESGEYRDVEFHDLQDDLYRSALALTNPYHPDARLGDFGAASCEQIASQIAARLTMTGYTVHTVRVDEDREHTGQWIGGA